jgi:hypothetical protein
MAKEDLSEMTPAEKADYEKRLKAYRQAQLLKPYPAEKKTSTATIALWAGAAIAVWYFFLRGK